MPHAFSSIAPGPDHAIELAEPLELTDRQLDRVRDLFAAARAEIGALTRRLAEQERRLERLYATGAVTPAALEHIRADMAEASAALSRAQRRHQGATAKVLTPAQVARYRALRGEAAAA
jgi:Spy/CpxP family protein refolding chaperone